MSAARIGLGARTGGLNAHHWIDDLSIVTYTDPKPGIVRQPERLTMVEGSAATFAVTLNNGDGATVQWLRDGTIIPGATGTSYTLSPVSMADSGAKFSARVTLGANTVTSDEATLTVVQIDLPDPAVVSYDFNDGLVPVEAMVYGLGLAISGFEWAPYVSPYWGVDNSGVLLMTENVNSQSGAFIIPDPHAAAPVYGVAARFDVLIGGGTDVPADGMSFNFANDLPYGTAVGNAEEGQGSGLRVCFDIYDNGGGEAPAITLKWGETVVGEVKTALSDITTGDQYADVIVRVTPDGLLDVAWNGKVLMYRVPVPGFGSITEGRFGFFARTGGLNDNHWMDDVKIALNTQPDAGSTLTVRPSGANIVIEWTGGGTLQTTAALPGGWSDVAGVASPYTTPAADAIQFFRVRQ